MTVDLVGIIDLADKIVLKRRLRGIDSIEVTIDERRAYAAELVLGRQIHAPLLDYDAPLAFLIESIDLDETAAQEQLVVVGRTLDGIAMAARVAWPSPADYPDDLDGYDEQTSVPAETALKHFVDANAGPSAVAARQVPGLAIATDAGRGITVSKAARYDYVVDVDLEIAYAADLGWKVTSDDAITHTFEIIEPTDRSDTVIFDFAFDALKEWEEQASLLDSRTLAIVAGQGQLTARDIVVRPASEPTGLDRREMFIDSTDIALGATTLLEQRGDAHLAASGPTKSVKATPREFGPFVYTRDWHLGDRVLLRNAKRAIEYSAQVIEVWITVTDSAGVPTIEAILDKPQPTLRSRIQGSFSPGPADQGSSSGGGGGLTNLDGGVAATIYGGTTAIDAGGAA